MSANESSSRQPVKRLWIARYHFLPTLSYWSARDLLLARMPKTRAFVKRMKRVHPDLPVAPVTNFCDYLCRPRKRQLSGFQKLVAAISLGHFDLVLMPDFGKMPGVTTAWEHMKQFCRDHRTEVSLLDVGRELPDEASRDVVRRVIWKEFGDYAS